MQTVMSQKLASYGQWTYRGAWALEIAAAAIGLTTGVALGVQAFSASESVTAMDLTLASAPFLMVAIAELTKIPIATLLFSASWLWKPIILVFLLVLAGITFETVFMGMERAGALRQLRYEELVNKIDALEQEATKLASADELGRRADQVDQARSEIEQLTSLAEKSRATSQSQIAEANAELEGTTALTPEASRVRDQVDEKNAVRSALIQQRDREVKDAVDQFERQRDSFVERIKMARDSGDSDSARRLESEVAKLANPRTKIITKFDTRIEPLDQEIAALRENFDRLRANSPPMTTDQRQKLVDRRSSLEQTRDSDAAAWQRRLDEAGKRLADAQAAEANKANTSAQNQVRQDQIAKALSALAKERIPMARTDQVRRIASRWYGSKPELVTEAQAGIISVIWFGSLALIAALAGPITAMVALALQRIAAREEDNSDSKTSRLLRRMLLSWRWRRIRTIKVPIEVMVEKEVEKRVEVPVEKVVKEILYVPLFTDDPEVLRKALDQDLPPEVSDLVTVSMKGRKSARPA
ncbi:hypothetical protein NKJ40_17225 [Mesorhizobium sp. M0119]|uniref:hypothetical protein n=1 Tax=Mesorhizobium sp. M0119 TaxID=2956885 RepID=UPI00333BE3B1